MKRLANRNKPKYLILIDIEIPDSNSDIAAAQNDTPEYIQDRPNIRAEYQLTEEQKCAYRDIVHNIIQLFIRNGFEIIKHYQSKKSYSYYIQVKPEFYEGIEQFAEPVEVKFRISDHAPSAHNTEYANGPIVHTIFINEVDYKDGKNVVAKLRSICQELRCGNYESVITRI